VCRRQAMALEPVFRRRWRSNWLATVTPPSTSHLSGIGGALGQIIQKLSTLSILWGRGLPGDGWPDDGRAAHRFSDALRPCRVPHPAVVQLWQTFQQVGLSVEGWGISSHAGRAGHESGKNESAGYPGAVPFLENVRFRTGLTVRKFLRNFSCVIAPRHDGGIVGRSGSGKSPWRSCCNASTCRNPAASLIDGIDLQQADPMWLRRQIGVVLQENFLFNGTIRDNIAIHNSRGLPWRRSWEMAKLAGAHDFILELPEAYDTPVGERGTALSGGQRQRVAIAARSWRIPRILIFDEATSALDYESERIIQDNLGRICKGARSSSWRIDCLRSGKRT